MQTMAVNDEQIAFACPGALRTWDLTQIPLDWVSAWEKSKPSCTETSISGKNLLEGASLARTVLVCIS